MTEWRIRPVAGVVTALLVGVGLTGCFGGDPAQSSASPTTSPTLLPGVEPTFKTEDPEPIPLDAVMVFAGVDPDGTTVSASGYIAGVIENGGTCTFTFSGSGPDVIVTSEGLADSKTTSCGTVQTQISDFTSGTWTAVLSYQSDKTGALTSEPLTVEVP